MKKRSVMELHEHSEDDENAEVRATQWSRLEESPGTVESRSLVNCQCVRA